MSFKTKRTMSVPTEMTSKVQLVMVSHDDNLVFEDENMAPQEQLEYFERFAQTRLALQDVESQANVNSRQSMGAFIHDVSLRWVN